MSHLFQKYYHNEKKFKITYPGKMDFIRVNIQNGVINR